MHSSHTSTSVFIALTSLATVASSSFLPAARPLSRYQRVAAPTAVDPIAITGEQKALAIPKGHYGDHAYDEYEGFMKEMRPIEEIKAEEPFIGGSKMLLGDGSNGIRLWSTTSSNGIAANPNSHVGLKPAIVHVNPEEDEEYCPVVLEGAFVMPELFLEDTESGFTRPSYTGLVNGSVATRMSFRVPSWSEDHTFKGKRCDFVFALPSRDRIPDVGRAFRMIDGEEVEFKVLEPKNNHGGRIWKLQEGQRAAYAAGMCPEDGDLVTVQVSFIEKEVDSDGELWWRQPWGVCPVGAYIVVS